MVCLQAHPVGAGWFSIDWSTPVTAAPVVVADPFDASVVLIDATGKVLVVENSPNNSMAAQALRAQAAGAVGIIVVNDVCESTFPVAGLAPQVLPGADGLQVTIPVVAMERDAGLRLVAAAQTSTGPSTTSTVTVTITTGYRRCSVGRQTPVADCPVDSYQWPPAADTLGVLYRRQMMRIVGFWDRWFEQQYFEMDAIGYADNRQLQPTDAGGCKAAFTANTYRSQTPGDNACVWSPECQQDPRHIKRGSTNPCLFAHNAWQAFHFRREDVMMYSRSECTRCTDANADVGKSSTTHKRRSSAFFEMAQRLGCVLPVLGCKNTSRIQKTLQSNHHFVL